MTEKHTFNSRYVPIVLSLMVAFFVALPSTTHADNGGGLQVNIGSNGGVLVRGAKVTAVSSTTVDAKTSFGSSVLNWIVKADNNTDFVSSDNAPIGIAHIQVGDSISFRGILDQAVSGLTVHAKIIKDWSHMEVKQKLSGSVSAINATLGSFTVFGKNSATTSVQTSSSTTFTDDDGVATFADLFLNAKVKVKGFWNASTSIFTATAVDIDGEKDNDDEDEDQKHGRGLFNWIRANAWFHLR